MTTTDARRFAMYRALRNELGVAVADTLMEHLPPAGWGDVARQSDIEVLRADMSRGFVETRTEIVDKMNGQLRWIVGLFGAQFLALAAIAFR